MFKFKNAERRYSDERHSPEYFFFSTLRDYDRRIRQHDADKGEDDPQQASIAKGHTPCHFVIGRYYALRYIVRRDRYGAGQGDREHAAGDRSFVPHGRAATQ